MVRKVSIQPIAGVTNGHQVFIDDVSFGNRISDLTIHLEAGKTPEMVVTIPFQTLEINDVEAEVTIIE